MAPGLSLPPSPSPSFPADSVRGIRSPSRNLRGRNAAREGEGGRRGRGIFDVSLSEAVDFHMVEGGGRACEVGLEVGAASPRRAGAGRDLGPRDARGEGPDPQPREPCRPPAPGRASPGHSPPRRWPPPCAPRPPSPSCPPGSPRAGGGNRRPRPDSASPAAGRSGGGAGRGGKELATRCVGQRSSGQSVTPRGAPAGGGAGGGIRARRRPGGAARTVWCPRRGGGRPAWEGPVTLGGKWGLGLCPRTFPKVRAPRGSPSTRARCPGRRGWAAWRRRWRGGFQECATGVGAFRIPAPTLPSQTKGSSGILSRHCRFADFLKSYNFLFSFQPSISLGKKNRHLAAMGRR